MTAGCCCELGVSCLDAMAAAFIQAKKRQQAEYKKSIATEEGNDTVRNDKFGTSVIHASGTKTSRR